MNERKATDMEVLLTLQVPNLNDPNVQVTIRACQSLKREMDEIGEIRRLGSLVDVRKTQKYTIGT